MIASSKSKLTIISSILILAILCNSIKSQLDDELILSDDDQDFGFEETLLDASTSNYEDDGLSEESSNDGNLKPPSHIPDPNADNDFFENSDDTDSPKNPNSETQKNLNSESTDDISSSKKSKDMPEDESIAAHQNVHQKEIQMTDDAFEDDTRLEMLIGACLSMYSTIHENQDQFQKKQIKLFNKAKDIGHQIDDARKSKLVDRYFANACTFCQNKFKSESVASREDTIRMVYSRAVNKQMAAKYIYFNDEILIDNDLNLSDEEVKVSKIIHVIQTKYMEERSARGGDRSGSMLEVLGGKTFQTVFVITVVCIFGMIKFAGEGGEIPKEVRGKGWRVGKSKVSNEDVDKLIEKSKKVRKNK